MNRATSSTWSFRAHSPCGRPRADRCGRGQTCGSRRAGDRTADTDGSRASCTSTCGPAALAGKSSPLRVLSLFVGWRVGGRRCLATLFALAFLLVLADGFLVSLGVFFLELLERSLLGLGPETGLLLAALLLSF